MLRVIGGKIKGHLLKVPKGLTMRPTSDKVRESLFNIIPPSYVEGARFMDLFAGCGAIGIEALSRGAEFVTFVESNPRHARIIRENIERCGFKHYAEVFCADVLRLVEKIAPYKPHCDIIFVDPPYDYQCWKILLPKIEANVKISDYGFLVIEHSTKVSMPDKVGAITLYGNYIYGDTTLTVYRKHKNGGKGDISRDI